ncbi:MAG: DsbA family protein [Acholeplasmataceae bacterium]
MKIELWVDYLCPLTYRVHQNLIDTIDTHDDAKTFEVLYRSYEMIPNQKLNGTPLVKYLALHHMMTDEEVLSYCQCIQVDITDLVVVDVKHAHQLSHLAKHKGLAMQMNQSLFEAYFSYHLDISDPEVLLELGIEVGLNPLDIQDVLANNTYRDAVDLNRENALLKGIHNVPHMRIDGKHRLDGYIQAFDIKQSISKAKATNLYQKEHCEGENCERKKTR